MRYYELICLFPANKTEAEIQESTAQIEALIKEKGGEIAGNTELGKFRLAYPIGQARYAIYRLFVFKADPARLRELEGRLRLSRELVRFEIGQITEDKMKRKHLITQYEPPLAERGERSDTRARPRRFVERPAIVVPRPASVPVAQPLTTTEIEKQIDKILEEKIL